MCEEVRTVCQSLFSRDGAQVTRLGAKHLCLLSCPTTSRILDSYRRQAYAHENVSQAVRETQKPLVLNGTNGQWNILCSLRIEVLWFLCKKMNAFDTAFDLFTIPSHIDE